MNAINVDDNSLIERKTPMDVYLYYSILVFIDL